MALCNCQLALTTPKNFRAMRYITLAFLSFLLLTVGQTLAQKPFVEGVVSYRISIESPEHTIIHGQYIFTLKGSQIRKELKMENGYEETELINTQNNTIYNLQIRDGKKYAIQLSMNDALKRQSKYTGYTVSNEQKEGKSIAGYAVYRAMLKYKDGTATEIQYTHDWYPSQSMTFERFPDARFMPMTYAYTDEHGITMRFEAVKVSAAPVENSVFRIPVGYTMISNEEYEQMNR